MTSNGIGPRWFPARLRRALTAFGSSFFVTASWDKHDEGYALATPPRAVCDAKFLTAMIVDSEKLIGWRKFFSRIIAHLFYALVRLFGWMTYGNKK